jgi:hypothetical protein
MLKNGSPRALPDALRDHGSVLLPITACPARTAAERRVGHLEQRDVALVEFPFPEQVRMIEFGVPPGPTAIDLPLK